MSFNITNLPDYDQLCYELMHTSLDHVIDLAARCNAHSDVLAIETDDDDDPANEGPHPIKVLRAQLGIEGADEEVQHVSQLIHLLSNLLICRHSRRVIHNAPSPVPDEYSPIGADAAVLPARLPDPSGGPGAGAEDSGSLHGG